MQENAATRNFWDQVEPNNFDQLQRFQTLINHAVSGSPYLASLMAKQQASLVQILKSDPKDLCDALCLETQALAFEFSTTEINRQLRQNKSRAALVIALADIGGLWTVEQVTKALAEFADACLQAAVNFLLLDAHRRGKIILADTNLPSKNCGYVALAMGKHGAFELNYSSDIDLIILYDAQSPPLAPNVEPSTFFVKLTRELVCMLHDLTEDGYVFRVDLRLRPDPRATQMAISLEAAAIYYETQGQNWERAAMIKARAAAGDLALGLEFLNRLTSYIWRKYLDYAAIADVQSLKRQIHAVKGHSEIAIEGHNLKLGLGGIREIEFFVQTQQLIAGGRNPKLRGKSTLEMLDALAQAEWITPNTAEELKSAYRLLRMLEHRAQMVDDQQTHLVPKSEEAFESYARFSGFEDGEALRKKLGQTLQSVQAHYAALFEDAGELAGDSGSLVFTGGEDDPATIETLSQLGFAYASEMSATIRGWHFGRYAATKTARAREQLTELMPALLKAIAQHGDADQTFLAFDNFLKNLPSGIQLFALLKSNPQLLDLLTQVLGSAPRLAQQLGKQPRILEAVVGAEFFKPLLETKTLSLEFDSIILSSSARDEAMDHVRILAREHAFRTGVRVLSHTLKADEAGASYSAIAEACVQKLLAVTQHEMTIQHGHFPNGECVVVALGKLGGREMTASSDLDLMLIYDHTSGVEFSDGPKPLSPSQYYARLTQRLITAMTVPTAEGELYEVDLRLRPSGSKGPVAISFESFANYQKNEAWTWEKLALTRARVLGSDTLLAQKLTNEIGAILCEKRDLGKTLSDVRAMRQLMLKEQPNLGPWDLKRAKGGLVEIEFIAQYLQLIHAHKFPEIRNPNTMMALNKIRQLALIPPETSEKLGHACGLYQSITQVLRLCLDTQFDPEKSAKSLNHIVSKAANMPDIAHTEALLIDTQTIVSTLFEEIIGRA